MRFDPSLSREAVLVNLRQEAEQVYGAERLAELAPFVEVAATALWRLAQAPLEPTETEPDLLASGGPRG
jgi:hypothetical protein